jgi:hypothetical protein
MTGTYSRMKNREKRIQSALEGDIGPLRKRIVSGVIDQGNIALSENLWEVLEFQMKERFPEFNIVKVGINDAVADIAEMVGSTGLLTGDQIGSLVLMVWMVRERKVLDLRADEFACNSWAEKLARKVGVEYTKIPAKKSCTCGDWRCYPGTPIPPGVLEYDEIFMEMKKLTGKS